MNGLRRLWAKWMDMWKNWLIDEWILTELNEGENYE